MVLTTVQCRYQGPTKDRGSFFGYLRSVFSKSSDKLDYNTGTVWVGKLLLRENSGNSWSWII